MSQLKRNNIIFYSILFLIVISCIGGTIYAIDRHNKNVDNKSVTNKPSAEIKPYLTFPKVSESKTIDVFKEYPINPITISENNNRVIISGLKNKEIENKINQKLSRLDATSSQPGSKKCYVNFNVSNILSISCNGSTLNLNLVTGEELKIEEVFNKDSDIYEILVKSIYQSLCSWDGCSGESDPDYEWDSKVENNAIENLQSIKNHNYYLGLFGNNLSLFYGEPDDFNYTDIYFYDFLDDITIYDRYLDTSIYENEVKDYCNPNACLDKFNYETGYFNIDDNYSEKKFLTDRTFISLHLDNSSKWDPFYEDHQNEKDRIDMKKFLSIIQNEIIKKEKIELNGGNYTYIDIWATINYHSKDDYQLVYTIDLKNEKKKDFIKELLGAYEVEAINQKRISRVNMLIDKTGKITYLNDNPKDEFPDFETKLYDYIIESLKKEENDFENYNTCEFADDYEECIKNKDYHDLIKEASYAVDRTNNYIHIYEQKPGIGMSESYVNASVPLDVFETNENYDIPSENLSKE